MSTTTNTPAPVELRWIEEPDTIAIRPTQDEFETIGSNRTFKEAILKKCKENMFVPVGLIATTACLTMGLMNMKRGDMQKQQLFMRGRVGFQGFTLVAMTAGAYLAQRSRTS